MAHMGRIAVLFVAVVLAAATQSAGFAAKRTWDRGADADTGDGIKNQAPKWSEQVAAIWNSPCNIVPDSSPDDMISKCTAEIDSGDDNRKDLAWYYWIRGTAYSEKGDHERAIKDFEESGRLDPSGGGKSYADEERKEMASGASMDPSAIAAAASDDPEEQEQLRREMEEELGQTSGDGKRCKATRKSGTRGTGDLVGYGDTREEAIAATHDDCLRYGCDVPKVVCNDDQVATGPITALRDPGECLDWSPRAVRENYWRLTNKCDRPIWVIVIHNGMWYGTNHEKLDANEEEVEGEMGGVTTFAANDQFAVCYADQPGFSLQRCVDASAGGHVQEMCENGDGQDYACSAHSDD